MTVFVSNMCLRALVELERFGGYSTIRLRNRFTPTKEIAPRIIVFSGYYVENDVSYQVCIYIQCMTTYRYILWVYKLGWFWHSIGEFFSCDSTSFCALSSSTGHGGDLAVHCGAFLSIAEPNAPP